MDSPRLLTRVIFGVLCSLAFGFTIYLGINHNGLLAAKISWIAAILFTMTLFPPPSPFTTSNKAQLEAYRLRFGLVSVFLLCINLFVVFLIQLPHDRRPHFEGVVTGYSSPLADTSGKSYPVVEYYDDQDNKQSFADRFAPIVFPKKTFEVGEKVSVIIYSTERTSRAYIDEPFLKRWNVAILVIALNLISALVAIMSHVRLLSITSPNVVPAAKTAPAMSITHSQNTESNFDVTELKSRLKSWARPDDLRGASPRKVKFVFFSKASLLVIAVCIFGGVLTAYKIERIAGLPVSPLAHVEYIAVFIAFAFLLIVPVLYIQFADDKKILENGVPTLAKVLSVTQNGRAPATVRFYFLNLEGVVSESSCDAPPFGSNIQIGDIITIVYLEKNPRMNILYPSGFLKVA